MKLFKQITCAVLTLCLCAGLLLIPSAPVSAATGPSAPKAVDVSYYKNYPMVNDSAISVQLGTNGKNIKNIKTSSKNLKAKVTRLSPARRGCPHPSVPAHRFPAKGAPLRDDG